jgi:hypothetical protein
MTAVIKPDVMNVLSKGYTPQYRYNYESQPQQPKRKSFCSKVRSFVKEASRTIIRVLGAVTATLTAISCYKNASTQSKQGKRAKAKWR